MRFYVPVYSVELLIISHLIYTGANLVLEGTLSSLFGPQGGISFGTWLTVIGPLSVINLIVLWVVLVVYFLGPLRGSSEGVTGSSGGFFSIVSMDNILDSVTEGSESMGMSGLHGYLDSADVVGGKDDVEKEEKEEEEDEEKEKEKEEGGDEFYGFRGENMDVGGRKGKGKIITEGVIQYNDCKGENVRHMERLKVGHEKARDARIVQHRWKAELTTSSLPHRETSERPKDDSDGSCRTTKWFDSNNNSSSGIVCSSNNNNDNSSSSSSSNNVNSCMTRLDGSDDSSKNMNNDEDDINDNYNKNNYDGNNNSSNINKNNVNDHNNNNNNNHNNDSNNNNYNIKNKNNNDNNDDIHNNDNKNNNEVEVDSYGSQLLRPNSVAKQRQISTNMRTGVGKKYLSVWCGDENIINTRGNRDKISEETSGREVDGEKERKGEGEGGGEEKERRDNIGELKMSTQPMEYPHWIVVSDRCPSVCLSVCLCVCLCVHLSVCLSVCLSV